MAMTFTETINRAAGYASWLMREKRVRSWGVAIVKAAEKFEVDQKLVARELRSRYQKKVAASKSAA